MMHQQIEDEEIIERYVRNQLAPEERRAFEEHFFSCDECFEKVQDMDRFLAGVRDASQRGLLDASIADAAPVRTWGSWMLPAFAASAFATLVFAAGMGWMYFVHLPNLRQQLNQASADLRAQHDAVAALEQQLARGQQAEANLPLVMLQATRDAQASSSDVTLPIAAQRLVLWIEVPAGKFHSFQLQVETADNHPVQTLDHLERNSYGALAVSLPADRLQPGEFRIKLTGEEPPPASLLAEYRLRIRRP